MANSNFTISKRNNPLTMEIGGGDEPITIRLGFGGQGSSRYTPLTIKEARLLAYELLAAAERLVKS
jgi:hypothetical protein